MDGNAALPDPQAVQNIQRKMLPGLQHVNASEQSIQDKGDKGLKWSGLPHLDRPAPLQTYFGPGVAPDPHNSRHSQAEG